MGEEKERTLLRKAVDWLISEGKLKNDAELAEVFSLSKGTISTYLNGKPGKEFILNFQTKFGINLSDFDERRQNRSNPPAQKASTDHISNQAILNLTESNKLMAEANKIQSEANRIQAEANKTLAESNRQLMDMLKVTGHGSEQMPASVAAKFEDLLELLSEVASGKKFESPQEAGAVLRRQFYGTPQSV